MATIAQHIIQLYYKSIAGSLSEYDRQVLTAWLAENPVHARMLERLFEEEAFTEYMVQFSPDRMRQIDEELNTRIRAKLPFGQPEVSRYVPVHRVHFLKTAWFRAAVAVVLIFLGLAIYYSLHTRATKEDIIEHYTAAPEILPGSNKATLTLSDGKTVELNAATSETIKDGNIYIANNDGQLVYSHTSAAAVNLMSTPKGGQYRLVLADGTKVWLNAASSIAYPTAFNGVSREVSITGEVYFEVAKDKSKPFIVNTAADQITVLGTSFNVNAYTDEAGVRTSLIEGSVKIGGTTLQQGEAYQQGIVAKTDISQDIAWKNGYFDFNKVDAAGALRQIARWYNVEIQFAGGIPKKVLEGKMGRDLNLSQVMETLYEIGIKTQLKGNILLILP